VITRSIGLVLGLLAAACWSIALACAWDEVRLNWSLLLLVPTDLWLAWGGQSRAKLYLEARLASLITLTLLSLVGVIAQPLWTVALLAALPLSVLYWQRLRHAKSQALPSPAASPLAS
jgi:hypothetical protein